MRWKSLRARRQLSHFDASPVPAGRQAVLRFLGASGYQSRGWIYSVPASCVQRATPVRRTTAQQETSCEGSRRASQFHVCRRAIDGLLCSGLRFADRSPALWSDRWRRALLIRSRCDRLDQAWCQRTGPAQRGCRKCPEYAPRWSGHAGVPSTVAGGDREIRAADGADTDHRAAPRSPYELHCGSLARCQDSAEVW